MVVDVLICQQTLLGSQVRKTPQVLAHHHPGPPFEPIAWGPGFQLQQLCS
jgi:hypothetical protein